VPKTLAEIAIEAGLVTKAGIGKAGKMAEQKKLPLVAVLVRELKVDEVALVAALRKQTRVPLLDPQETHADPDALRLVGRDLCHRLRVLPLSLASDGPARILRVAMADPTDSAAVAELESVTRCEIDVAALPLSAIEELVDRGYKAVSTGVVSRPRPHGDAPPLATRPIAKQTIEGAGESEISVTARVPLSLLQAPDPDLEARFLALCHVLLAKGLVTEAELADALKKLKTIPEG
jgi:hypothetical protein